jgi:nucleoporin POM34
MHIHKVPRTDLTNSIPLPWQHSLAPYPRWLLWITRLLFLLNSILACKPLMLTPDACEDVPLTPRQRKLLGLPPMTRPATPQEKEQYVTPPRFTRSATPRSARASASSPGVRGESGDSPLSGRGTPVDANGSFRRSGGSPYSNSTLMGAGASPYGSGASPFGSGERRRLSYTSTRSSPLTVSEFEAMGNPVGSPSGGRKENRASVGLNNKWLYEKGRTGSGGRVGVPQTPGGGRMPGMAGLY